MFNYGKKPTIAVQNQSTLDLGCNLSNLIAATQTHLDRDFFPAWGRSAILVLIPTGAAMPDGAWHCFFVDKTEEPGAEGYHDFTPDGLPVLYIDVSATLDAGDKVSVTFCHEIDEAVIDPAVNVEIAPPAELDLGYTECAGEPNDAVECDEYPINGIAMSNFVLPAWFAGIQQTGLRYDFMGLCKAPFEVRPGGYLSVKKHGRWTQIFGPELTRARAKRAKRRHQLRALGGLYHTHPSRVAHRAA